MRSATVCWQMNIRAPISAFDGPSRAGRATSASWAVRSWRVSTLRLRTRSPVAGGSRTARAANASIPSPGPSSPASSGDRLERRRPRRLRRLRDPPDRRPRTHSAVVASRRSLAARTRGARRGHLNRRRRRAVLGRVHAARQRGRGWRISYEIRTAGGAATKLVRTPDAGGIALTVWALWRVAVSATEVATGTVCDETLTSRCTWPRSPSAGWACASACSAIWLTLVPALFGVVVIVIVPRCCSPTSPRSGFSCGGLSPRAPCEAGVAAPLLLGGAKVVDGKVDAPSRAGPWIPGRGGDQMLVPMATGQVRDSRLRSVRSRGKVASYSSPLRARRQGLGGDRDRERPLSRASRRPRRLPERVRASAPFRRRRRVRH
jgi:hypothetical protein